jgi:hypothetical protein
VAFQLDDTRCFSRHDSISDEQDMIFVIVEVRVFLRKWYIVTELDALDGDDADPRRAWATFASPVELDGDAADPRR